MRITLVTTALLFVLAAPAAATEFTGENASFEGADLVGRPVSLGNDQVLEIDGARGLIRDYANPLSPAWVGAFSINAGLIERGVYHDGVFIGLHNDLFRGATLFDLANPAAPTVLSSSFAPYHFTSAVLRAHALYLTTADWLIGYDLTVPTQPVLMSLQILHPYAGHRWPSLVGDLLYLVDGTDRLRVFDLAAAGAPADLGTISLPTGRLDAVAAGDHRLYALQSGPTGVDLATYDLALPLAPAMVDAFPLLEGIATAGKGLVLAGGTLYATTSAGRMRAFSLAAPDHPAPGFDLACDPNTVAVTSHALLLYAEDARLRVLERTPFDQPPALLAERRAFPELAALATNGRVSLASEASTGDLLLIDLADPRSPVITTRWPGAHVSKVAITGGLAAACSPYDLRMIDIADPAHPALISLTRFPGEEVGVRDCALADGLLAVGLPSQGVLLYNVNDPATPRLSFTMRQIHGKVELGGGRLLTITGMNRASVYDVSNPKSPQWMGALPPSDVRDAALSLDRVVMLTEGGLRVYRINGDQDFTQLSRTPAFGTSRLVVTGNRVYAYGTRDTHIIDITDPTQPVFEGWFEGDATILALAAEGGLVHADMGMHSYLVRDETWATARVPGSPPSSGAVLLPPAPNPFNPAVTVAFEIPRAQDVRLTIHDLRGHLVARLAAGVFAPGRHEVTWRGQDDDGAPAPSGVYLVRLTGDDAPQTRRVTLLR